VNGVPERPELLMCSLVRFLTGPQRAGDCSEREVSQNTSRIFAFFVVSPEPCPISSVTLTTYLLNHPWYSLRAHPSISQISNMSGPIGLWTPCWSLGARPLSKPQLARLDLAVRSPVWKSFNNVNPPAIPAKAGTPSPFLSPWLFSLS
jgi:hypothetical protein